MQAEGERSEQQKNLSHQSFMINSVEVGTSKRNGSGGSSSPTLTDSQIMRGPQESSGQHALESNIGREVSTGGQANVGLPPSSKN